MVNLPPVLRRSLWVLETTRRLPPVPRRIVGLGVGILILLGIAGCSPAPVAHSSLALEACQVSAPRFPERFAAKCGVLSRPENPQDPSGKRIPIHFAVLEPTSGKATQPPLFLLAGGPGQSGLVGYVPMLSALARIRRSRALVLIDLRGTGRSNGLECPMPEGEILPSDSEASARFLQDCLKQLPGDPRFYTSALSVDDVDALREGLGYSQIDLLGQSYGSRAALVYLRRHEARVRALVLAAVAPPHQTHFQESARTAEDALDATFLRCEQDDACRQAFPSLREDLESLLEGLPAEGVQVSIPHPATSSPLTVQVDRDAVLSMIFLYSYSHITAAMLPLLIHEAAQTGDVKALAAHIQMGNPLETGISIGLHTSVTCAEDRRRLDEAGARAAAQGTLWGTTLLDAFLERCAAWPVGDIPPDAFEPVTSAVPVLLVSGALDPVTPPRYGADAARTLKNSLHVVVEGASHDALQQGCILKLVEQFLSAGQVQGLDVSCVSKVKPIPFFLSRLGPRP